MNRQANSIRICSLLFAALFDAKPLEHMLFSLATFRIQIGAGFNQLH
jgi:hypothetical protein